MQRGKRILLSHAVVGSRPCAGSDFISRHYRIKISSKTTNKTTSPNKTYIHSERSQLTQITSANE